MKTASGVRVGVVIGRINGQAIEVCGACHTDEAYARSMVA
jgi:hypothetical protein